MNVDQKIWFVGIHYKKGFTALDSETYTGKVVDDIAEALGLDVIKTNLCCGYSKTDPAFHARNWVSAFAWGPGDVIVLLGKFVQQHFIRANGVHFIDVYHPSSFAARRDRSKYIEEVVSRIRAQVMEKETELCPNGVSR